MHEQALKMALYIDKTAVQRAKDEALNLTREEFENINKFGHPLVKENFKPHITLAYDSKGLLTPEKTIRKPWKLTIDDVFFAEIGKYGSITKLIEV